MDSNKSNFEYLFDEADENSIENDMPQSESLPQKDKELLTKPMNGTEFLYIRKKAGLTANDVAIRAGKLMRADGKPYSRRSVWNWESKPMALKMKYFDLC